MAIRKSLIGALALVSLVGSAASSPTTPGSQRRLLGDSFGAPGSTTYDYVVVGGGNAGLPLAVRLAEAGCTVAVVEAGSYYEIGNSNYSQIPVLGPAFTGKNISDESPQVDWGIQTTPQAGQDGETPLYPRGKTLGGSSARNFMAYQRGTIGSYQAWADAVDDQSYTWDNLLPYFEKSITFTPPSPFRDPNDTALYDPESLKGNGPVSVTFGAYTWALESWGKLGLAQVGIPERQGFTSGSLFGSSNQLLTVDATEFTRESSQTSFLHKLGLKNPYLTVYPHTLVTRVLFDANRTATGVDIDFGGRNYTLTARKEVILSAGAFQSPQLLMVSGIGPAATLAKYDIPLLVDLPGVGQDLWDHTLGGPTYRVDLVTNDNFARPDFVAESTKLYNTYPIHGPYASINGNLLAFEKLPEASRQNFSVYTLESLAKYPSDWPEIEYLVISAFGGPTESYSGAGPDGHNYATIQAALVAPFSRGNVTISSPTMYTLPVVNPAWLTDPRDAEVAVAAYKRVRAIFATSAMAPIVIGPEYYPGANVSTDAEILAEIRESFGSVYHASCTCKMGNASDPMAVVDSRARVRGVQGLRVVDTSSFALLPPGHPMSTVYMFAEKIADDILNGR